MRGVWRRSAAHRTRCWRHFPCEVQLLAIDARRAPALPLPLRECRHAAATVSTSPRTAIAHEPLYGGSRSRRLLETQLECVRLHDHEIVGNGLTYNARTSAATVTCASQPLAWSLWPTFLGGVG